MGEAILVAMQYDAEELSRSTPTSQAMPERSSQRLFKVVGRRLATEAWCSWFRCSSCSKDPCRYMVFTTWTLFCVYH